MRNLKRVVQIFLLSVLISVTYAHTAYAAGSVSLSADKDTCSVGDDYKVTVNADNPADASIAPEISITYDTRRLSFKDCSCSYGGGGGGLITLNDTNADITFSVLSGGTAVVEASAVFDGDGADAKTASVTLSVDGEDIASLEDAGANADLGIEGGSIAGGDGSKLVSAVFADEFMPMGFYKTSVTYEEQLVEAAQFDMGNIVLLYVTDENGNNGNFNVYDQETGELSDFLQISGIENRFIIVLRAKDAETEAPDGFILATLQWNEQTLDAYAHEGLSDFFLVYAISSEGNKGWYMYDQKDGTYQRFVNELYSGMSAGNADAENNINGSDDEKTKNDGILGGLDIKLIVIIALAVILLGLLTAVIIMGVKLHEFNSYEYIDEDEYEEQKPQKPDKYTSDKYTLETNKAEGSVIPSKQHAEQKTETRRLTASELVAREMNSGIKNPDIMKEEAANNAERGSVNHGIAFVGRKEAEAISTDDDIPAQDMPKTDNIYEKYREMDEAVKPKDEEPEGIEITPEKDEWDDDLDDDVRLSRSERKALKAEEKARKKAEKKMKKEYGEFGPADFSQWQEAVRDDRKVSEEDLQDAKSRAVDVGNMPLRTKTEQGSTTVFDEENSAPEVSEPENLQKKQIQPAISEMPEQEPVKQRARHKHKRDLEEPVDMKKDSYVKMMKKLPANDNNEPVQPKPVQQFDLDDDFEFEYLNLDDDD